MDKHDIFISYSRRDKTEVDKIIDVLVNNGYTVWIDVDGIESGEAFRRNIVEAIENSSIVIFFSSNSSNMSKWTTKEISLAVEFKKHIIPIKLDNTRYNKNVLFDLVDLDYIDLSEDRLKPDAIQKLMKTIISKIGKREKVEIPVGVNSSDIIGRTPDVGARQPIKFDIKSLKETIIKCWLSRNNIINIFLILLTLLAFIGLSSVAFGFGFAYSPASIIGLLGIFLLLCNKEDGIPVVAGAALLWTLTEAYLMAPSASVFRFFQNGNFIIVWSPLVLVVMTVAALFIRKDGVAWWRRCSKISMLGTVLLTIVGIFWLWIIYFDTVTKMGLPPNIRYYIHKYLG